jgi:fructokinase
MIDVVALGEVLIDFTPSGVSKAGNELFERNPGGAPANVLAAISKLGRRTAFIGKVGKDQFGTFLEHTLKTSHIDTSGLIISKEVNTTLAFVHLDDKGDRSFSFYRNPGADMTLSEDEINFELIKDACIFHFGSVSMTHEPSRTATMKAVRCAKENGVLVSYDPNLRIPLWNDLEEARSVIAEGLKYTDLLKISEEELIFLTGENILEIGAKIIRDKYGIDLIFITLGKKGCFYSFKGINGLAPTFDVKTVDTTGAGDAFLGGMLYKIAERGNGLSGLKTSELEEFVDFANATGSMATTKRGAIPAMPSISEIQDCICNTRKLIL